MGFKKGLKGCLVEYFEDKSEAAEYSIKIGTVVDRVSGWYLIADNDCRIHHVGFKNIRRIVIITKFEKVSNE
jgi:hypothetical protein